MIPPLRMRMRAFRITSQLCPLRYTVKMDATQLIRRYGPRSLYAYLCTHAGLTYMSYLTLWSLQGQIRINALRMSLKNIAHIIDT